MDKNQANVNSTEILRILKERNAETNELIGTIAEIATNIDGVCKDVFNLLKNQVNCIDGNVSEVAQLTDELVRCVEQIQKEIPTLVANTSAKIDSLENRNQQLDTQLGESLESSVKANEKVKTLENELKDAANFGAALGAVTSVLLWKVSKSEENTLTILNNENGDSFRDFLLLILISLKSFMQKYQDELPPTSSFEYSFATSMLGIFVNISGHAKGRNFILEERTGVQIVEFVMDNIEKIEMPAGYLLKRLAIIFLFNISISKRGSHLFQLKDDGIKRIFNSIKDTKAPDIQIFALRLIMSLIEESESEEFKQKIPEIISFETLQKSIEDSHDDDYINIAKEFMQKLNTLKNNKTFY